MDFQLTQGQEKAQEMVKDLLGDDEGGYGVLTGFAGSGKTFLLQVLAEEHGPPQVLAPTGKAALRVREATGLEASTIHRYLYRAVENPKTGETTWAKKPHDQIAVPENRLLVVDEASMLGQELWLDLWGTAQALGLRVLLTGDTFQLPPVVKDRSSGTWRNFSVLTDLKPKHRADLTEVVRQALGSPIIRASMLLRQGEGPAMDAVMSHLEAVPRKALIETFLGMPAGDRALIVHRNQTRHALNLEVRTALGYTEQILREEEPLLVLENNYKLDRFNGEVSPTGVGRKSRVLPSPFVTASKTSPPSPALAWREWRGASAS